MKALLTILITGFVSLQTMAQVPTAGLVAYYPFNGNTGDSSGNNNHGTLHGPLLTTDRNGRSNGAYLFNGITDYISVPASTSIQPANAISVVVWFAPDSIYSQWTPVLTKRLYATADPYDSYSISHHTGAFNNRWEFGLANSNAGSGRQALAKSNSISYGNWNFIAATYDGSNIRMFVNGSTVSDTVIPFSGNIGYSSSYELTIGYNTQPGQYFHGKIDDILIYNRALSVAEIMQLYAPSTGIDKINENERVSIYPNPVSDILNISLQSRNPALFELYDAEGRLMESKEFTKEAHSDVSKMSKGLYFAHIKTHDEEKFIKILIQ